MALAGSDTILGALILSSIQAELAKTGNPPGPTSIPNIKALSDGIAKAVVQHLITLGEVAPGIPTAGSPAAQATVAPGKFI